MKDKNEAGGALLLPQKGKRTKHRERILPCALVSHCRCERSWKNIIAPRDGQQRKVDAIR